MAKKSTFFCKECGYENIGWLGKCPSCGAWNSMVEAPAASSKKTKAKSNLMTQSWVNTESTGDIIDLDTVASTVADRLLTGNHELDRVLGGGFVSGSLVLIGGDPGIGKSTLLLQVLGHLCDTRRCLYISGEESPAQIKLRAQRLGLNGKRIRLLPTTDFNAIAQQIQRDRPDFVIVDSIQTVYVPEITGTPGSVGQVREATAGLLRLAKHTGTTIVLVGHVTKEGSIAGPRILEHMVDTVLYFEGEGMQQYRILRAVKNRFGTTDEVGIFEMTGSGLLPVPDASTVLITGRPDNLPGSAVTSGIEGTRPLLLELQALVSPTIYSQPLRMTQGLERMRLSMLLAVLGKISGNKIGQYDIYVNVTGGLKIRETAADLAIICAVVSSIKGLPVPQDMVVLGEIGLAGELRAVINVEKRIQEAIRLGWKHFVIPQANFKETSKLNLPKDCKISYVTSLSKALHMIFSH